MPRIPKPQEQVSPNYISATKPSPKVITDNIKLKILEDKLRDELRAHIENFDNPHKVTREQLDLEDISELVFKNHFEFPNVGVIGLLYIATDEQIAYYWNGEYFVALKGDVPDIDTIICGGAE